jgi:hypothetical protein
MESAAITVDVLAARLSAERILLPRCGRFSTGIERLPDTAAKARIGRFSDGIEQRAGGRDRARTGRCSTGIERWPDAHERSRVGSFADGYEHIRRR